MTITKWITNKLFPSFLTNLRSRLPSTLCFICWLFIITHKVTSFSHLIRNLHSTFFLAFAITLNLSVAFLLALIVCVVFLKKNFFHYWFFREFTTKFHNLQRLWLRLDQTYNERNPVSCVTVLKVSQGNVH